MEHRKAKTIKISRMTFALAMAASLVIMAGYPVTVYAGDSPSIGEPGRGSGKKNPLKNVYFGEEHLHTRASPDSFVSSLTADGPASAKTCCGDDRSPDATLPPLSPEPPAAGGIC